MDSVKILSVDGVVYVYPTGVRALDGVSLELFEREVIGILGPSGCGKSTLLSIIAGLAHPTDGTVRWNVDVPSDRARSQRVFTMVFQKDTVLPWLTVEANVGLGLRYLQIDAADRRERVRRLLHLAGLEEARAAYPYQLSGGMRRRVAFLAGVAPLPRVLLLDEPFAALDEPTRVSIHAQVLAIVKELGIAVILVTHDLGEVISLCDRAYVLTARPGRVVRNEALAFEAPRDVRAIRETVRYQEYYRLLWHELNAQITRTEDPTPVRGPR